MKIAIKQIDKMMSCVAEEVFWRSQDALWNNKKYVEVSEQEYRTIMERYKKKQLDERRLSECVELNNKGIELEKNGETDAAIEVYEKNIKPGCWPARHSFDRLLVLYRKRKDYTNELRVCKAAIELFDGEVKYKERMVKINKRINK